MLVKLVYTILIPFFVVWQVLKGLWLGLWLGLEKVGSYWKCYVVLEIKAYWKFINS